MSLEIRDPQINQQKILAQVMKRAATHHYHLDLEMAGPENLRHGEEQESSAVKFSELHEQLIDLMVDHTLIEPDFQSAVPLFGRLIVGFRRVWNWVATKWYLRPIMQQQSGLNAQMALIMYQMLQENIQFEGQISHLKQEIAQLQGQTERSQTDAEDRMQ